MQQERKVGDWCWYMTNTGLPMIFEGKIIGIEAGRYLVLTNSYGGVRFTENSLYDSKEVCKRRLMEYVEKL